MTLVKTTENPSNPFREGATKVGRGEPAEARGVAQYIATRISSTFARDLTKARCGARAVSCENVGVA